jgi:tRNA A-37 threonylcarbamoyl transferase component Bud32
VTIETGPAAGPAIGARPTSGAPPTARLRRHRRPSGEAPPLPRKLGWSGRGWLVLLGAVIVWLVVMAVSPWASRATDRLDAAILRGFARFRTEWLTDVAHAIIPLRSEEVVKVAALVLVVVLLALRRWRHLFTFLGSVQVYAIVGSIIYEGMSRPRPFDVTIIGDWEGYSLPALPFANFTFLLVAITYTLVVPGRPRAIAKGASIAAVAVMILALLYLAVDHPFDILVSTALAVGIAVNAFRYFTPNEAFPVAYRRGKTAHLDVTGRRGEAVRQALRDQLGLDVIEIKPVGLEGSGGSTPLRLKIAGDPERYAMNHVRADRWYKLGRTILYGRLEDEAPFHSVRRLVEYEDYAARVLRDAGIVTATPYGIVEMTPEREYLLLTEFFDGAQEIGEAVVDDGVIDEALRLVRQLWDAGLAHRDIKPANVLVRNGHVILIDVFFVQVRPSPWRQAVDLANMMLVLAVRTDPERVYQRALHYFSPDEIAEAFAAVRGIASPTQLRTVMKQDGRDLVAQFRALAPPRRPITLQRWSLRRVALTVGVVGFILLCAFGTYALLQPEEAEVADTPTCGTDDVMVLMAQAVPTAESVPCVSSLPAGWDLGAVRIKRGDARFWLDSDQAGSHAVEVRLLPPTACVVGDGMEVPSDELGIRRFERPEQLPPDLKSTRFYLVPGGCVIYKFSFEGGATAALMFAADNALSFQRRETLVRQVDDDTGLRLCGAGSPCPGGS